MFIDITVRKSVTGTPSESLIQMLIFRENLFLLEFPTKTPTAGSEVSLHCIASVFNDMEIILRKLGRYRKYVYKIGFIAESLINLFCLFLYIASCYVRWWNLHHNFIINYCIIKLIYLSIRSRWNSDVQAMHRFKCQDSPLHTLTGEWAGFCVCDIRTTTIKNRLECMLVIS